MEVLIIKKINNGYIVDSNSSFNNKKDLITYHPDWISIIKHIDGVWGEIEREVLRVREKDKKQVRTEVTQPTKEG